MDNCHRYAHNCRRLCLGHCSFSCPEKHLRRQSSRTYCSSIYRQHARCYYPAVRTGSSNTHFFSVVFFFFGGHLPQTSGFRSAKEILAVSFATQPRAIILSDRNIFYTPRGGQQRRGLMPLGLFLLNIKVSCISSLMSTMKSTEMFTGCTCLVAHRPL